MRRTEGNALRELGWWHFGRRDNQQEQHGRSKARIRDPLYRDLYEFEVKSLFYVCLVVLIKAYS